MDFNDCIKKRIAKEVEIDRELINSLKKTSQNKIESQEKLELNEITASSKISLLYDSLRELLEALAIKNSYKIYNHECYTYFLKEILNESTKGDEFDEIRKIRNGINYYAKDISISEAEDILKRMKILRELIYELLKMKYIIKFKEMILEKNNTVKIVGEFLEYKIHIKTSILQIAKIFGTDKEVLEELADVGFGSEGMEEKCVETREVIKKFPNINTQDNKIEFNDVSFEGDINKTRSINQDIIQLYAEDIVGWNNEGIFIDFPKEVYKNYFKDNQINLFLSPFEVELIVN